MMPSEQAALDFPCGDVVLAYCPDCGFITNTEFDPQWSAYAPNYEDQQSYSPTFNEFALGLGNHLIEKYGLHQKRIIEIGCSKGDFLLMLCELGDNVGIGIDPSVIPGRVKSKAAEKVEFVQAYYSHEHAKYEADFICCRHTLEHIQPTYEFVKTIRDSIGDRFDVPVFFEIPDTVRVLKDLAFEDIYYEHCSYFTPGSLARLFRSCGFEIVDLYRDYGDQYLMIEARPAAQISQQIHPLEDSLVEMQQAVAGFAQRIDSKLNDWKQKLETWRSEGKRVVIWGSGSKCVSFLTTLKARNLIDYVVDINPHRHGKFIPGVGKEICPPEYLQQHHPDKLIIMNDIYRDEISRMVAAMGISTDILSL